MADKPNISDEMKKMDYEPLLPAEKKMIIYNLVIGVVLLTVLVWVNHTFFSTSQIQAPVAQTAGQPAVPAATSAVPVANVTGGMPAANTATALPQGK